MYPIIWLTGLPCSGKTTIARELARQFRTEVLDGDDLRSITQNQDFSLEGRARHMDYVGEMANRLSQYIPVAISLVSPIREVRDKIKEKYGNVVEVYVACPMEVCAERDVKGMWKKAREGEIKNFTGYGAVYEEPENPDLILKTNELNLEECVQQIITNFLPEGECINDIVE